MIDIELNPQGDVVLNVDKSIYDESVIDKVLYWWAGDYVITRRNTPGTSVQTIIVSLRIRSHRRHSIGYERN